MRVLTGIRITLFRNQYGFEVFEHQEVRLHFEGSVAWFLNYYFACFIRRPGLVVG